MTARALLIDNYDSFTYNLVQAFRTLGAEVLVERNDQIDIATAKGLRPSHLVISPGPGRPDNAGVSLAMVEAFAQEIPILGVCLGHQCLVQAHGGTVVPAMRLMHGKTSPITHDGQSLFRDLPQPLSVGRYHSLAAARDQIPECLVVTAQTDDGEVMAVRHKSRPIEGVQFHPESVLTPEGNQLLNNFLKLGNDT